MIYTVPELNQEQALHHFIYKFLLIVELTIKPSALLDLEDRSTNIAVGTNMLFPSMEYFGADLTCLAGELSSSQHKGFGGSRTSWTDASGCYRGCQMFSVDCAR